MVGAYGDDGRGLDADGRREFRVQAARLTQLVTLEGILTSPLVRAVQTAEILADAFGIDEVIIAEALAPGGNTAKKMVALALAQGARFALVGHQPSLSQAVSILTAGRLDPSFKKGAAFAFRHADAESSAEIVWKAEPGKAQEPIK